MIEESQQKSFIIFISGSMGEVTKLQHQNIRMYVVNVCRSVFTEKAFMYH